MNFVFQRSVRGTEIEGENRGGQLKGRRNRKEEIKCLKEEKNNRKQKDEVETHEKKECDEVKNYESLELFQ
jgi:hypothetical protein